jgi:hypothetical protein
VVVVVGVDDVVVVPDPSPDVALGAIVPVTYADTGHVAHVLPRAQELGSADIPDFAELWLSHGPLERSRKYMLPPRAISVTQ